MYQRAFVREPAVAGTFYPAGEEELRREVDSFLRSAKKQSVDGRVVGIIVPHAGYPYSGLVAAQAFKQLEGEDLNTVVLIGPSHRSYFDGVAVYSKGEWKTPLGPVQVDEDLAAELIAQDDFIVSNPAVHQAEHSLEVQLPFLQRLNDEVRIVPLMMGVQTEEMCKTLGNSLAKVLARRSDVLIVASTDLYHGYSYAECLSTDSLTLSHIEQFDPDGLLASLAANRAQACGGGPVAALLHGANQLGARETKLLRYTNSGDVTGSKTGYVVGYSAWLLLASHTEQDGGEKSDLSEEEKTELLTIARKSIECRVLGQATPQFEPTTERLREKRGAFVTLNKDGRLRGCIGYILPMKPLYQTVSEVAVEAALYDPRFPPLKEEELSRVTVEISALTPLERIDDPSRIEVGKHGIYMKKGMNSGLLLPQVATEYGWMREAFLEHTCSKAGLPKDAWKEGAEIYIFSAEIFHEQLDHIEDD
jgi:AmmeMemoRadiSam system protein B/AmmeMemoRadiSam system protein A